MWTVIAYRKICGADRAALALGHLLPRRFELHITDESSACSIFESYKSSSQVLAVELYNESGLVARHDLLVTLAADGAGLVSFGEACHDYD